MEKKSAFKLILGIALLSFTTPIFAIFCPSNFSQIEMGDTIQQVIQTCGNPASQNTYVKSVYRSQEWVYYVKTSPFSTNTARLNVVLLNDQVVNITLTDNSKICQPVLPTENPEAQPNVVCIPSTTQETKSVGSTSACGPVISVGSSADQVQAACGQAAFVNHGQQADAQITYTELLYNGPPPTSLIFENGVLKNRVQNNN